MNVKITIFGYLAQLVERLTVNQNVGGSSPSISVGSYIESNKKYRAIILNILSL